MTWGYKLLRHHFENSYLVLIKRYLDYNLKLELTLSYALLLISFWTSTIFYFFPFLFLP